MNRIIMGGGMSISVALPSMTAAPSNVKKREIRKGGYPASEIEYFGSRPIGPELFLSCERSLS